MTTKKDRAETPCLCKKKEGEPHARPCPRGVRHKGIQDVMDWWQECYKKPLDTKTIDGKLFVEVEAIKEMTEKFKSRFTPSPPQQ